ncbi:mitochondrial carrier domain-containing protein, partial [Peziza echinospora]
AIAGSVGSAIANLAVYPLDVVVKRLQGHYEEGDEVEAEENYEGIADAFEKIFEKEGVRGLYAGVVEDTVNTIGSGFWYFATYTALRHQRLKQLPPQTTTLPVLEELSVGILAGAISKFFSTPISNIVTRKQTAVFHARLRTEAYARKLKKGNNKKRRGSKVEKPWTPKQQEYMHPSSISIIQDIYDEHGASGFWAGYKPSVFLTLNPAITFLLYEGMIRGIPHLTGRGQDGVGKRGHPQSRPQTKTMTFLLGALAKAMASTITYPLAVIKTRSMIKSQKKLEHHRGGNGMVAISKEIYKKEGIKGFYVGLLAEVLRGFFSNGISMLVKETIFHTLTSMYLIFLR